MGSPEAREPVRRLMRLDPVGGKAPGESEQRRWGCGPL